LFKDDLEIPNFQKLKAKDFKFCTDFSVKIGYLDDGVHSTYFILCPNQIILAKPRNLQDRIEWLVDQDNFEEAFQVSRENLAELKPGTFMDVGQKYLFSLFSLQDYKLAASLCPEILAKDEKAWQLWVYKFAEINQLSTIYKFLPFKETVLDSTIYELFLSKFLDTDKKLFLSTLQLWPSSVYNLKNVIISVNNSLKAAPSDSTLLESLFILYYTLIIIDICKIKIICRHCRLVWLFINLEFYHLL